MSLYQSKNVTQGILTGCDEKQEWMLKTWWEHYDASNFFPVTFIDFGMTKSARMWCEKRGQVLSISAPEITPKEKITPPLQHAWETYYSEKVWQARPHWFSKPFALLKTPYEKTIWIDLDTFVIRPIDILFTVPTLALAKEVNRAIKRGCKLKIFLTNEIIYNTGVISYKKEDSIIQRWAENCLTRNHQFIGDQEILSRMIYEENDTIHELSADFNWRPIDGITDKTAIIHFANRGKQCLYINLKT